MKYGITIMCVLSMMSLCAGTVKGADGMIEDGKTVLMNYTLTVDGEKVDSSEGREPLQYTQGEGNIVVGLEKELAGLLVGESKTVVVTPEEGYGQINPDAFQEVPKEQLPEGMDIQVGAMLSAQTPNGGVVPLVITEIRDTTVLVDFNHPLAGKELTFEVTIVDVQ